ncbi:MAG: hypothetical protein QXR82_02365 [Candidatus Bathyarchaeia archaeon]
MKTQLIYLAGILIIVWFSMILVIFIIANFITKFTFPFSGWIGSFLTNIFRTILGVTVSLVWLYGWKKLYIFYFKWCLRKLSKL